MTRASRRAQAQRIKNKRSRYYGRDLRNNPRALGMVEATACVCSCGMCDNHKSGRSIKELAANEAWRKIERA